MTTERRYTCNLCHSRMVERADGRGDIEGTGVIFGGSHAPDQPLFKFVRVQDAENHLCGPCIASVRKLPQ